MDAVGVSDYLALTNALTGYLHKLSPVYDFCIVDEAQDFGTTELQIIRGLTRNGENDIFLCGDVTQHILAKQQNIKNANERKSESGSECQIRNEGESQSQSRSGRTGHSSFQDYGSFRGY